MSISNANFDPADRRTAVRRTAWIVDGVALTVFVLFILKTYWH